MCNFKNVLVKLCFTIGILLIQPNSINAILDGRTTPVYLSTLYTFTGYDWAIGDVYFRKGFKVNPGVQVNMAITQPVRETMDLSSTGILKLYDNLTLNLSVLGLTGGTINAGLDQQTTIFLKSPIFMQEAITVIGYPLYINLGGTFMEFPGTTQPGYIRGHGYSGSPGWINITGSEVVFSNGQIYDCTDLSQGSYLVPIFRVRPGEIGSSFRFSNVDIYLDGNTTYTIPSTINFTGVNNFFSRNGQLHTFRMGSGKVIGTNGPAIIRTNTFTNFYLDSNIFLTPENITFALNNGNLRVNGPIDCKKLSFQIESGSSIECTGTGSSLTFGDGLTIANDTNFLITPGASITMESGLTINYKNIH